MRGLINEIEQSYHKTKHTSVVSGDTNVTSLYMLKVIFHVFIQLIFSDHSLHTRYYVEL